jgi:hypothetical protein
MRLRFAQYFRLAGLFIALLLWLPTVVSAQGVMTGGLTGIVTGWPSWGDL